ncbi:hypothetical protein HYH03_016911 [Edaphochlamys debaryana]|uniref:Uncharacterized protein n=1 Tax=Edaphochlamys debaryana TaxID=47281 RepID=A0A835XJE5_9CHLO|nr:hypothetical protein HYH03_016911 [Edaphochlamys debaryana]|eukprot:KAG2484267.1 hypothetical protein HYH03_016911 [Edaphochlamys debaryana]
MDPPRAAAKATPATLFHQLISVALPFLYGSQSTLRLVCRDARQLLDGGIRNLNLKLGNENDDEPLGPAPSEVARALEGIKARGAWASSVFIDLNDVPDWDASDIRERQILAALASQPAFDQVGLFGHFLLSPALADAIVAVAPTDISLRNDNGPPPRPLIHACSFAQLSLLQRLGPQLLGLYLDSPSHWPPMALQPLTSCSRLSHLSLELYCGDEKEAFQSQDAEYVLGLIRPLTQLQSLALGLYEEGGPRTSPNSRPWAELHPDLSFLQRMTGLTYLYLNLQASWQHEGPVALLASPFRDAWQGLWARDRAALMAALRSLPALTHLEAPGVFLEARDLGDLSRGLTKLALGGLLLPPPAPAGAGGGPGAGVGVGVGVGAGGGAAVAAAPGNAAGGGAAAEAEAALAAVAGAAAQALEDVADGLNAPAAAPGAVPAAAVPAAAGPAAAAPAGAGAAPYATGGGQGPDGAGVAPPEAPAPAVVEGTAPAAEPGAAAAGPVPMDEEARGAHSSPVTAPVDEGAAALRAVAGLGPLGAGPSSAAASALPPGAGAGVEAARAGTAPGDAAGRAAAGGCSAAGSGSGSAAGRDAPSTAAASLPGEGSAAAGHSGSRAATGAAAAAGAGCEPSGSQAGGSAQATATAPAALPEAPAEPDAAGAGPSSAPDPPAAQGAADGGPNAVAPPQPDPEPLPSPRPTPPPRTPPPAPPPPCFALPPLLVDLALREASPPVLASLVRPPSLRRFTIIDSDSDFITLTWGWKDMILPEAEDDLDNRDPIFLRADAAASVAPAVEFLLETRQAAGLGPVEKLTVAASVDHGLLRPPPGPEWAAGGDAAAAAAAGGGGGHEAWIQALAPLRPRALCLERLSLALGDLLHLVVAFPQLTTLELNCTTVPDTLDLTVLSFLRELEDLTLSLPHDSMREILLAAHQLAVLLPRFPALRRVRAPSGGGNLAHRTICVLRAAQAHMELERDAQAAQQAAQQAGQGQQGGAAQGGPGQGEGQGPGQAQEGPAQGGDGQGGQGEGEGGQGQAQEGQAAGMQEQPRPPLVFILPD